MDNVKKMARSQSIKMTEFLRLPSRVEVTVEDENGDIEAELVAGSVFVNKINSYLFSMIVQSSYNSILITSKCRILLVSIFAV